MRRKQRDAQDKEEKVPGDDKQTHAQNEPNYRIGSYLLDHFALLLF